MFKQVVHTLKLGCLSLKPYNKAFLFSENICGQASQFQVESVPRTLHIVWIDVISMLKIGEAYTGPGITLIIS